MSRSCIAQKLLTRNVSLSRSRSRSRSRRSWFYIHDRHRRARATATSANRTAPHRPVDGWALRAEIRGGR